MKRKCLAVGIILLFVGTCIIPAIAQEIERPSLQMGLLSNNDFVLKSNSENNLKPGGIMDFNSGDLDTPLFIFSELMNKSGTQTAWGLTSADFNKDGNMDFAVAYADLPFPHAIISIFYNNGNGNFTKDDVYTFDYDYISNLNSGDFNNDGYIDLLYTYNNYVWFQGLPIYVNGTVNLLKNDGTNSFGPSIEVARLLGPNIPYDPENRINPKLTIADYDEDGNLDFIVGDNSGTVELYDNDGSGNFSSAGIIHDYGDDNGDMGLAWGVTSADFDGDADIDLLVAARVTDFLGHVYFIQNMMTESNHSTIFEPGPGKIIADITKGIRGTAFLTSLDYNDNGMMDFIAGIENEAYLYINKGEGTFEPFYICRLPDNQAGYMDVLTFGGMTSADYNNDGYTDVIMGGVQGRVRLFINNHILAVITRPKDTFWYKFDQEQYQLFEYTGVLCIGKITIGVSELENLEKVEFYINGILRSSDTTPPYNFTWRMGNLLKHRHMIKIIVYGKDEKISEDEMRIWRFL
jgi:hypothetical protein